MYYNVIITNSIPSDLLAKCQDASVSQKSICLDMFASIVENEKTHLKQEMTSVKHGDEYYG